MMCQSSFFPPLCGTIWNVSGSLILLDETCSVEGETVLSQRYHTIIINSDLLI